MRLYDSSGCRGLCWGTWWFSAWNDYMCFAGTLCGLRKEINQRNWSTTKHAAICLTNKETLVLITSQTLCVYMFAIGCTEHPVKGVTPCSVRSCTNGRRGEGESNTLRGSNDSAAGLEDINPDDVLFWIVRGKGGLLSFARKPGTRGVISQSSVSESLLDSHLHD